MHTRTHPNQRSGLADPDPAVREAMVAAGVAVVDLHGAAHATSLMPLFSGYLEKRNAGGRDEVGWMLLRGGGIAWWFGGLGGMGVQGRERDQGSFDQWQSRQETQQC